MPKSFGEVAGQIFDAPFSALEVVVESVESTLKFAKKAVFPRKAKKHHLHPIGGSWPSPIPEMDSGASARETIVQRNVTAITASESAPA